MCPNFLNLQMWKLKPEAKRLLQHLITQAVSATLPMQAWPAACHTFHRRQGEVAKEQGAQQRKGLDRSFGFFFFFILNEASSNQRVKSQHADLTVKHYFSFLHKSINSWRQMRLHVTAVSWRGRRLFQSCSIAHDFIPTPSFTRTFRANLSPFYFLKL